MTRINQHSGSGPGSSPNHPFASWHRRLLQRPGQRADWRYFMVRIGFVVGVYLACAIAAYAQPGETPPVAERRVFVPIEELDTVFERDKQGVMLPRAAYDELVQKAAAAELLSAAVPTAITQASYQARVVDQQLLISITATLRQFSAGWQTWSFPLPRLAVEQAQLNGRVPFMTRAADGTVTLLTEGVGTHELKLEVSTEITRVGSDQLLGFGLLRGPVGELELTLPAGKRLFVGTLAWPRPTPLDQAAEYRVPVGGLAGVQLRITDRAVDQKRDALMFASTGYGLHMSPGEVTWRALTTLQVFGQPIDKLVCSVPNTLEVAEVDGPGLERWELSADPQEPTRKQITLTFGQAFDGVRKVAFRGVMSTPAGESWQVPSLQVSGTTAHIGQIVIQHAASVRARVESALGVRRALASDRPMSDMPDDMSKLRADEYLRFDIWQSDFTLQLITQLKERVLQSAVAAVLDVNRTGLELSAAITLNTYFAPLFEVDLRLPAEWTLLSVTRDNQPLTWQAVPIEAGNQLWRIGLNTPLATNATAVLQFRFRRDVEGWPVEAEPIQVPLPELFLPQSSLQEASMIVRGDDDLELVATDVVGLDPVPLKADFERLRFQSQDTVYSGQLRVARKASRASAQSVVFARLEPTTIHVFSQAQLEILGGGLRVLHVKLPESVGTAVLFQAVPGGPRIVEQKPVSVENGQRTWRLQFDQRVRGPLLIQLELDRPRPANQGAHVVPLWQWVEADRQSAYLAVESGGEQRVTMAALEADGTAMQELDPLELPQIGYLPKERIVGVFRMTKAGGGLTLSEDRFDRLAVPTAISHSLRIASVWELTGDLQHRADYTLSAVGVQNLRVRLPRQADLWAATVDDKPVEVRRNDDLYLIPFPTSDDDDAHRRLTLFYRTQSDPQTSAGQLRMLPPELSVLSGQGTGQPVEVMQAEWIVQSPPGTLIVDSRGRFEPVAGLDRFSWLNGLLRLRGVPSLDQIWFTFVVGAIWVVVVSVVGFVWWQRSWKFTSVIAGLLGMLGCGGVLGMLMLPMIDLGCGSRHMRMQSGAKSNVMGEALPSEYYGKEAELLMPDFGQPAPAKPMSTSAPMPPMAPPAAAVERPRPEIADGDRKADDNASVAQRDGPADPLGAADAAPKDNPIASKPRVFAKGLMSLALTLPELPRAVPRVFRYFGAADQEGEAPLELHYIRAVSGRVMRIFLIVLCLYGAWWVRRESWAWKARVALFGWLVPLALHPLAAVTWLVALDGLFFGTSAAVVMWLICGCSCWSIGQLGRKSPSEETKAPTTGSSGATGLFVSSLILGLGLLSQPTSALAQEPPRPAAGPKSLIIPFNPGDERPVAEQVLIPYEEFLRLSRLADPDRFRTAPPQSGGLVETLCSATLVPNADRPEESLLQVKGRLTLVSYVDGQLRVPLPFGKVAFTEVLLDGQPAPLVREQDQLQLVVAHAGDHVVDVQFTVPARLSGSTGSVILPFQAVTAGRLAITLPTPSLVVRVNGSTTAYRRLARAGTEVIEVPLDKAGDLSVAWQPEQAQQAGTAVVHVDSASSVVVSDAGITLGFGFQYKVRQGSVSDVTFSFPDALRLQGVSGPDVGGWELQGTDQDRKLRVMFRRNVNDQTQLQIQAFVDKRVTQDPVALEVPQAAPLEVTNEIGMVAVYAGDQFTTRVEESGGLAQVDGGNLPTTVPVLRPPQAVPRFAYRFSKRPFTLRLRVLRQAAVANVSGQHGVFVSRRKLRVSTRFDYSLSGSPLSSLSFKVPAGMLVLDVKAVGLSDWYTTGADEDRQVTLEFNEPRTGQFPVFLSGTMSRDPAQAGQSLAVVTPQGVTRVEHNLAVWLEAGYTATVDGLGGWKGADRDSIPADLAKLRSNPAQFVFRTNVAEPDLVRLTLSREAATLSASVLNMLTVSDVVVVHSLILQWQVERAAVDVLYLTGPATLKGKLEFSAPGLRDVTETELPNQRHRWALSFRMPVSGKVLVSGIAKLPPASAELEAPAWRLEEPGPNNTFQPLAHQTHDILLLNASQRQLTHIDSQRVESLQRTDLPIAIEQALIDQATELVRVKNLDQPPRWVLKSFAAASLAPASVNIADFTTTVARDGTYRTQARLTIKNRSRQFLALRLPANSRILSVFVQDTPARVVQAELKSGTAQLVALPKTSEADLSFPVTLVISGRLKRALPKSFQLFNQELELPAPQIVSQQEDDRYGIPVARTLWTVHLPDDLTAAPLTDPKRHNLSVRADEREQVYFQAMIEEFNFLCSVAETSNNPYQRAQAYGNLKRLGMVLPNYTPQNDERGEFRGQQNEGLARFQRLDRAMQQGVAPNGPGGGQPLSGLQQFGLPGQPGGGNGRVSGLSLGDQLNQLSVDLNESSSIENWAISNTTQVLKSNRDPAKPGDQLTDELSFDFDTRQVDEQQLAEAARAGGKSEKAPAAKGQQQGESRRRFRSENEENLRGLNSDIAKKKESEQLAAPNNNYQQGNQLAKQVQQQLSNQAVMDGRGGLPPMPGEWDAQFSNQTPSRRPGNRQSFGGARSESMAGEPAATNGSLPVDSFAATGLGRSGGAMAGGMGGGFAVGGLGGGGGMAGMGGGVGMGGGGELGMINNGWSQVGGLSLSVDVPVYGQKLAFSKTGGEPQLTLSIRPKSFWRTVRGWLWALGVAVVGLGVWLTCIGPTRWSRWTATGTALLATASLIAACLLTGPLFYVAFAAFIGSSAVTTWKVANRA